MTLLFSNSLWAQEKKSGFSVNEITINRVQELLKNHKVSCVDLVTAYIDRIKKYNLSLGSKPPINAITEINPFLLNEARSLDKKINNNKPIGRLFCVPFLLKDNIDTYETHSTSGSLSLLGNQPIKDAPLVAQLRKEDAIILGKASMDEFASGIFGISGRNGRTGNVYDTNENPGGSSSGPAAAISANFAVAAIGTDNSGSVRIPAAFNGVVGLRPTAGLISQEGILPRGNIDGIAGPLTRTVEDLAVVLDIVVKSNMINSKSNHPISYLSYLNELTLKHQKIGVIKKFQAIDSFKNMPTDSLKLFENYFSDIKKLGVEILPEVNLPDINLDRALNEAGELQDMNEYLNSYPSVRKNYQDICTSGRTTTFGTKSDCIKFIKNLPQKFSKKYNKSFNIIEENRLYIEKIMEQNHLDALLIPVSTNGSASYDYTAMINESIASNSGLPGITFNIGYTNKGMPVGVELIGKKFKEGELIKLAYAYEQKYGKRIEPKMPKENKKIETLDIPQYNNLVTEIGFNTFNKILKESKSNDVSKILTPVIFNKIYTDMLEDKIKNVQ